MASLKERVTSRVDRLRERRPSVDHAVRTFQHYGAVNGNGQAGAATYFGFLSFFPILALAFFVVGGVAKVYPDAQRDLVVTINQLPGDRRQRREPDLDRDVRGSTPARSV